jgi:hypothetical protein
VSQKLLNLRVSDELLDLIERAVASSDAPSRSEWARDILEYGAYRELAALEQKARSLDSDGRKLGMRREPVASCTHPPTARVQGLTQVTCGMCGAVVHRLM